MDEVAEAGSVAYWLESTAKKGAHPENESSATVKPLSEFPSS